MSVMRKVARLLLAAAVVTTASLLVTTTSLPATAASLPATAAHAAARPTLKIKAERLILEPGPRGYHGEIDVTVKYRGDVPVYSNVRFTEPVAGAEAGLDPYGPCLTGSATPRRQFNCLVPGGMLQPGETRTFTITITTLVAPRAYAMRGPNVAIVFETGLPAPASATTMVRTLFRSTSGSLHNPRPYTQDTHPDPRVTVSGTTVDLIPVTLTWNGDAPYDYLYLRFALPAGVEVLGIDPDHECGRTTCEVPGGRFLPGESRTLQVRVRAPADFTSGTGSVAAVVEWDGEESEPRPPVTFTIPAGAAEMDDPR